MIMLVIMQIVCLLLWMPVGFRWLCLLLCRSYAYDCEFLQGSYDYACYYANHMHVIMDSYRIPMRMPVSMPIICLWLWIPIGFLWVCMISCNSYAYYCGFLQDSYGYALYYACHMRMIMDSYRVPMRMHVIPPIICIWLQIPIGFLWVCMLVCKSCVYDDVFI